MELFLGVICVLLGSDERRLIERFQNSEKYYIQLLKNATTTYLNELPVDLRATLNVFLDTFDKIVKFHADTFYPKLLQCDMKILTICDLIKTHLDHSEFNIYFKYAAYVHEALHMIQSFYLNAVRIVTFYFIFFSFRVWVALLFFFYLYFGAHLLLYSLVWHFIICYLVLETHMAFLLS